MAEIETESKQERIVWSFDWYKKVIASNGESLD